MTALEALARVATIYFTIVGLLIHAAGLAALLAVVRASMRSARAGAA